MNCELTEGYGVWCDEEGKDEGYKGNWVGVVRSEEGKNGPDG